MLKKSKTNKLFLKLNFPIRNAFKYFFAFVAAYSSLAQNITVRGRAHSSYAGKIIRVYSELDFLTRSLQMESTDTIKSDGYFEMSFQSNYTQPVYIKIGQVTAELFVEPDFVYGITLPEIEQGFDYKNDSEIPVNIGIIGSDSTELNALLNDYKSIYNDFFASEDQRFLSRPMMFRRADSLQKLCDRRYKDIKNKYFKNYILYSIASINASVSRGENYLINGYILGKPILYQHQAYMDFFKSCFSGYLNAISSSKKGESIFHMINTNADYSKLSATLKQDKFLKNDSIRELVIIYNLWEFYFKSEYSHDAIKSLLYEIQSNTIFREHRLILLNIMSFINKMQVGSEAPDFTAFGRDAKATRISAYKGKWIYLNFFSTSNVESMREMPKIAALKKKFGDKVTFVSVCLDDSIKTYKSYLQANPKFDWAIWYNQTNGINVSAKEKYFVSGTEAYFLISNLFYLAQSPALSPSDGIEYRFNLLFKPKRKNTKTGIR